MTVLARLRTWLSPALCERCGAVWARPARPAAGQQACPTCGFHPPRGARQTG